MEEATVTAVESILPDNDAHQIVETTTVELDSGETVVVEGEEIELEDDSANTMKDHSYSCIVVKTDGGDGAAVPDIFNCVHEEEVIEDGTAGTSDSSSQIVLEYNGDVPFEEGQVIEIKEEDIIQSASSVNSDVEMSVAMDLANLSQGRIVGGQKQPRVAAIGQQVRRITSGNQEFYIISNATSTPRRVEEAVPDINDPNHKPKLSYAQLIAEAIFTSEHKRLTLSEIYQAISNKYPYYRMDSKGWQNAIRHNLSLNHSFIKVPRPSNEGRGNYWTIDASSEKTFLKRGFRYFKSKTSIANVIESS